MLIAAFLLRSHVSTIYTGVNLIGSGTTFAMEALFGPLPLNLPQCAIIQLGEFSYVWAARTSLTKQAVLVKQYAMGKLTKDQRARVVREMMLFSELRHPHIVTVRKWFCSGDWTFLIQQLMPGGDLFEYTAHAPDEAFTVEEAKRLVARPLLSALTYLHARRIIHRDVKPENVVLGSDMSLKLCDFGMALCCEHSRPVSPVGTPAYMAPEVLAEALCPMPEAERRRRRRQGPPAYDETVDVWALGCVVYLLLCGREPFGDPSDLRTAWERAAHGRPFRPWKRLDAEAARFIGRALCNEPGGRASAKELLEDAWLQ